jgi:uncharacterized repeat protein (TIGR02543 family)
LDASKTLTAVFEAQTPQVTTYCDYGPITEYGGGCFKMNSADDCDLEWGNVVNTCSGTPPTTSKIYCDYGPVNEWGGGCEEISKESDCDLEWGKVVSVCGTNVPTAKIYCDYGPVTEYGGGCEEIGKESDCDLQWGKVVSVCGSNVPTVPTTKMYCDYGPVNEWGGGCEEISKESDCDLEWGKVVSVCGSTEPPNTSTSYTLSTNVSPTGGGYISRSPDAASYTSGTSVTVTATAASGYRFKNWSGASTSTSNSVTITMDGNKTLTAVFESIGGGTPTTPPTTTYELTTGRTPLTGGTVSLNPSGGRYESGTRVTVTATPASGYKFLYWRGGSTSTSNSVTITMTRDTMLVAYFESTSTSPGTDPGTNPGTCSKPAFPTGVTAEWQMTGSIANIKWNSVSGATSYRIYAASILDVGRLGNAIYNNEDYFQRTISGVRQGSVNITSRLGTYEIVFWVKALNSCGNSAASDPAVLKP